ncbi:MAG TPA: hypothetical protein VK737_07640 [Opitutales bacterium]|nr:hypothetical protein [Opitutales bacterium]
MKTALTPPPNLDEDSAAPASTLESPQWDGGHEWLAAALHRHWPFFKSLFKEHYLILTDEDLHLEKGHEDEFLEHLERATCRPRQEIVELIAAHAAKLT